MPSPLEAREALAWPGGEQSSLTESGSAGLPDTPADSQPGASGEAGTVTRPAGSEEPTT